MEFRKMVEESGGRRVVPALVIFLTLTIGIVLGTFVSKGVFAGKDGTAPEPMQIAMPSPAELSASFASIASSVEPTVVNINTESKVRTSRRRFRGPEEGPFGDMFERFFGPPEGRGEGRTRKQTNLGSGVIVNKEGYILTNHHVVYRESEGKPVDRIQVRLYDEDQRDKFWDAKVVGADKETDLAVIKIDVGHPLPAAPFGDSGSMRVGDWVLAVGSPFGLRSTVTAGIISAKGREIEQGPGGQFKSYIQTDAAINPGNSGGPLVNMAGQIIGINTAIFTTRGGYDGVGFAIPSNTARKVYNSIIKSGRVSRGSIGITFNPNTKPAALRVLGADHGVLIETITPDSPAERAGLKREDVILSVDGQEIRDGDQLVDKISDTTVGSDIEVEYLRDGKKKKTKISVADRTEVHAAVLGGRREEGPIESEAKEGKLGIQVRNLTPNQAEELAGQLDLDSSKTGVLVVDVDEDGFAYELGIRRQQVILEINRTPVGNTREFHRLESGLKSGQDVLLLVAVRSFRGFETRYLADTLP